MTEKPTQKPNFRKIAELSSAFFNCHWAIHGILPGQTVQYSPLAAAYFPPPGHSFRYDKPA